MGKSHKILDIYADQVALYARMKICFVLNVNTLYEKKIEGKDAIWSLRAASLSVGLGPISNVNKLNCFFSDISES